MIVKIERLDHQGRGIAKVDNITTFIPDALVNEIVDIEIVEKKKNYNIGKVKSYIEKSNDRIEPICKYFNLCGGCDLMHMSYENQLVFKQDKVKNIIDRYTKIDSSVVKEILHSKELFYRNKVVFKVDKNIGFYDKKSYNVVPIDKCLISSKKINEILKIIETCNLDNINQIMIRTNEVDSLVVIYTTEISNEIIDKLKNKCSIIKYDKKYELIIGKGYITDKIGDYEFIISPDSFYQVNRSAVKILYDKVLEYLNPNVNDRILDLYSGTGTIGIYVSKYVRNVLSIEINKSASKDALKNKELNNISNIDFICDDVANEIDKIKNIDSIIVDPPRSGLDNKTIEYLKKIKSKKIIYVSCDPMTLARDLDNLSEVYNVVEITPVDMFPNTSHVECVAALYRRESKKMILN